MTIDTHVTDKVIRLIPDIVTAPNFIFGLGITDLKGMGVALNMIKDKLCNK